MKKFTAIALAVVMALLSLNLTLPVFAEATAVSGDAAALQAALSANEDVTLTADVDLSTFEWKKVENYTGTLDGNGKTIYLPDAPLFYTLYGTVKNLVLATKGDDPMVLEAEDADDAEGERPFEDTKDAMPANGVGVLANFAIGATVDNVKNTASVEFKLGYDSKDLLSVAVGGIVGVAMPEINGSTVVAGTTIKNCTLSSAKLVSENDRGGSNKTYMLGGIVGKAEPNTTVENCMVDYGTEISFSGSNGASGLGGYGVGGIVAYVSNHEYAASNLTAIEVKNCIFAGTLTTKGQRNGGIVSCCQPENVSSSKLSSVALNITNCVFDGVMSGEYNANGNVSPSAIHHMSIASSVYVTNCASFGKILYPAATSPTNNPYMYFCGANHRATISGGIIVYYPISATKNGVSGDSVRSTTDPLGGNYQKPENPVDTRNIDDLKTADTTYEAEAAKARADYAADNHDIFVLKDGKMAFGSNHDYKVQSESNELSAGVCACGAKSDADYAGFIQFAEGSNKVRFVMVISEDEIENAAYDSFTMTVTINGTYSWELNDKQLSAYKSVSAEDDTYTAAAGYQIFGVIVEMKEDVPFENASVMIVTGDDAATGSELYYGSLDLG